MRLITALAIAAALVAGEVQAQPEPWQPERSTSGWTFTPSMSFGGMWDSNVTIRNQGSPPVSEWVGLVSPRGEIDYNGRHSKFNAGYSGTLHAYRTFDELTRFDQRARMSARRQVTQRLMLDTRHAATRTPTTEDLEINGLPFVRVGSEVYSGRGGATYALSERTGVSADYMFQWIRFAQDEVDFTELRGGHAHGTGAALRHSVTDRVTAGAAWQYVRSELSSQNMTAHIQRAQGQAGWRVGRSTSISGAAGLSHLHVPETGANVTGPAFGAGVDHFVGQLKLSAHYEQSYVATFAFGSAMSQRSMGASVYVPLMRGRMFLNGGTSYRNSAPVVGVGQGIELDSLVVSTTWGLNAARWLRMETFYTGSFQESSARGQYDRTRIGVQFVTFKPVRIQ